MASEKCDPLFLGHPEVCSDSGPRLQSWLSLRLSAHLFPLHDLWSSGICSGYGHLQSLCWVSLILSHYHVIFHPDIIWCYVSIFYVVIQARLNIYRSVLFFLQSQCQESPLLTFKGLYKLHCYSSVMIFALHMLMMSPDGHQIWCLHDGDPVLVSPCEGEGA